MTKKAVVRILIALFVIFGTMQFITWITGDVTWAIRFFMLVVCGSAVWVLITFASFPKDGEE